MLTHSQRLADRMEQHRCPECGEVCEDDLCEDCQERRAKWAWEDDPANPDNQPFDAQTAFARSELALNHQQNLLAAKCLGLVTKG